MSNIREIKELASNLVSAGFRTAIPQEADIDWISLSESESIDIKRRFIDDHLSNIESSDVALIANFPKNGQPGYIGANVLMEIAFAYTLRKPIVLLFDPVDQSCRLEVLSVASRVLDGKIDKEFLREGV